MFNLTNCVVFRQTHLKPLTHFIKLGQEHVYIVLHHLGAKGKLNLAIFKSSDFGSSSLRGIPSHFLLLIIWLNAGQQCQLSQSNVHRSRFFRFSFNDIGTGGLKKHFFRIRVFCRHIFSQNGRFLFYNRP